MYYLLCGTRTFHIITCCLHPFSCFSRELNQFKEYFTGVEWCTTHHSKSQTQLHAQSCISESIVGVMPTWTKQMEDLTNIQQKKSSESDIYQSHPHHSFHVYILSITLFSVWGYGVFKAERPAWRWIWRRGSKVMP